MTLKPCIECGKDCEILPVQLGDFFTLTYLRVCSGECMFLQAYEYLREVGYHKQFRNSLHDKENEEDKKERDEYVKMVTNESLRMMREHLEACPALLSHPVPNEVVEMFKSTPQIPCSSGATMRFTRPSIEDRIKWAHERVNQLKQDTNEAEQELIRLIKEGNNVLE